MKHSKGEALTLIVVLLAAVGALLFVARPKWTHGETRRAEASKQATVQVEKAVVVADNTAIQQAAHAAAQVATIGHANDLSPDSPSHDFIAREVPAALANLPKPDPEALLEAEKRRAAVMEGRADEAQRLYALETKRASQLQQERDTAVAQRDAALEQRRAVDTKLSEAAAEHLAGERRAASIIIIAVLMGSGWLYTKLTHLSPSGIGHLAADIRNGFDPIAALDVNTPPWIHDSVQRVVKLAAELEQPKKTQ